jgi:sRNA-binding protein
MVLAYHTKSTRYLQKTIKATTRFDLDGNPAEPLEEMHKAHAEEMLKERAKKNAERSQAEQNSNVSSRRRQRKPKNCRREPKNKPACAEICEITDFCIGGIKGVTALALPPFLCRRECAITIVLSHIDANGTFGF